MKHPLHLRLFVTLWLTQLLVGACAIKDAGAPDTDNDTEERTEIRGILNGWETNNDRFRMVGSIVRTTSLLNMKSVGYWLCTGTLIAKNVVMTAAHCVVKADGTTHPVSQLFFSNRDNVLTADLNRFREVTSIRVVKGFSGRVGSPDIALLRLRANLSTGRFAIDQDGIKPSSNPAIAVGYGLSGTGIVADFPTAEVEDFGAGIRRFGKLKITELRDLLALDGSVTANGRLMVDDYNSRAGIPLYQQACHGDSGGPLFAKVAGDYRIVGVLSSGSTLAPGYCSQTTQSHYIATAPFAAWIKEKKEELSAEGGCRSRDGSIFVTADGGCRHVRGELVYSRESNVKKGFSAAARYCENLEQGGKTDWRLPTESELKALPFGSTEKLAMDGSTVGYQFWTNASPVRVYIGEGTNHGKSYSAFPNIDRNVICVRR